MNFGVAASRQGAAKCLGESSGALRDPAAPKLLKWLAV